ncbi:hypothetical protein SAMN04490220_8569 [Rhodococcus jostii]|uniref:Uncharacterized protein n=1 Tax=Rhodococcus jostii TaxID=132919 RepID=A0A1H5M0Z8_RHOJO|nr:hypothetical protein SAMN04490220_8569 [Rhodococcus jostii]
MGRPPGWAAALTGRAVMRSPGRPPVRRDLELAFRARIAEGLTSDDAAKTCGVSGPVGTRWFRQAGGMSPIELTPVSGRYLSLTEREDMCHHGDPPRPPAAPTSPRQPRAVKRKMSVFHVKHPIGRRPVVLSGDSVPSP